MTQPLRLVLLSFLFLLAEGAAWSQQVAPAQSLGTPEDLLQTGNAAYGLENWAEAERALQAFLDTYGTDPALAEMVRKVKPLLAMAYVRQGKFDLAEKPLTEALADPALATEVRSELRFFAGLMQLQSGRHAEARQSLGTIFSDLTVDPQRRMEALILGGMSYVLEENWPGAISFFNQYSKEIRRYSPEAGARADILHLNALIKAERWDESIVLAHDLHLRLDTLRQVVTFASLLIQLGDTLLEKEQPHRAIVVLRLVPTREQIIQMQQSRLHEADADLQYAIASRNNVRQTQLQTSLQEMEKDLEAIQKQPQFDAAARLRLAQAYFSLGRLRQSALLLDQMVRQMPPDALVESATVNLISGWMTLERWNRAIRAADVYIERLSALPEAKHLPGVLFARAQAFEGEHDYEKAAAGYAEAAARFPQDEMAPRARFMQAYNILQMERYAEAESLLEALLKDLPQDHEMWDHAFFWRAMAFYFDQDWEKAKAQLLAYLDIALKSKQHSDYIDDASFRHAYALFSEAQYASVIQELERFEKQYPASEWLPEAQLALGDSYGAIGELDQAREAYLRIPAEASGFHDEGWMKRGQILKALQDLDGMKAHYQAFLKERPESPRIAEALNGLGWVAKQQGKTQEAREIYWDTVRRLGDDEVRPGLEDVFLGLNALYPGGLRQDLLGLLQKEKRQAELQSKTRYLVRLSWAEAQLLLRVQPDEARVMLARLGPKLTPKEIAPRILVDCAEAMAAIGESAEARRLFEGLRQWYPRAPERDRAFAGLGFLALETKDDTTALAMFDRFEKNAVMPKSAPDANGISIVEAEIGGKVALARGRMLEPTDRERALHLFTAVQKSKAMPSRLRAEAFMSTASLFFRQDQFREALPFYEQVYVLFHRYPEIAARAYWGRGQALEKLGKKEEAREVYSELAQREDLKATPEAAEGRQRAVSLGGLIPPKPLEGDIPSATSPTQPGGAS